MTDPLRKEFITAWKATANKNSSIYDSLDGNTSVYRCNTIADFKAAFVDHDYPSYLDSEVKQAVQEIQGFLVDWPQYFFCKEDLSPSLATRSIIPNELWV